MQNGGCEYDKGPPPAWALDVLLGSQGCISLSLDNQGTSEPPLFMGWQNLQIHMPPIWSVQCPSHFHKAFTTSNGTPSFPGTKNHNLSGRHVDHAPGQGFITVGGGEDSQFIDDARVHNKLCQVTDAQATITIPGVPGGLQVNEIFDSTGEDLRHHPDMSKLVDTENSDYLPTLPTTRLDDSSSPSSPLSPNPLPTPTAASDQVIQKV